MRPFLAVALALLAPVGCSNGTGAGGRSETQRHLPLAPMEVMLTHSNVSQFDGQTSIRVTAELVDGNTVVTIPAITTWPVENVFRGLDQFFYTSNSSNHPIIRVKDQGCDESVEDGVACGWKVNDDGCTAAGFGCFASRKSYSPASRGATTEALVFVISGDAGFTPNDHGATFGVHGRFTEDCSGWFSDGTATTFEDNPACLARIWHTCSLSVEPTALSILRGSWGTATVRVEEAGVDPLVPITLSIDPLALPPGVTVGLAPNPVAPPGASILTVQTTPGAPVGATRIAVKGVGGEAGGRFECSTVLGLTILAPPLQELGVCTCPNR